MTPQPGDQVHQNNESQLSTFERIGWHQTKEGTVLCAVLTNEDGFETSIPLRMFYRFWKVAPRADLIAHLRELIEDPIAYANYRKVSAIVDRVIEDVRQS